jgi:CRISPR/Cas system-associated endonuclease Cas3-HD
MESCEAIVLSPAEHGEVSKQCDVDFVSLEIGSTVARLAKVLNTQVELVKELIAIVTCVHDIGKALAELQQRLYTGCGEGKQISLAGHELISTWFTYHLLQSLGNAKVQSHVKAAMAAGVLLHHVARRSALESYLKLSASLRGVTEDDVVKMVEHAFKCCKTLARYSSIRNEVEARLLYQLKVPYSVLDVVRFIANNTHSKYGELVAYVIAIADNIDAHYTRLDDSARGVLITRFCKV